MQNRYQPFIRVTHNTRRNGVAAIGITAFFFWLGYQFFNYWSTAEAINLYFGYGLRTEVMDYFSLSGENWWVAVFSTLIVGLDVFAVIVYIANAVLVNDDGSPMISKEMADNFMFGWIVATIMDNVLTWYVFAYRAEASLAAGAMRGPDIASMQAISQAIPAGMAILSWLFAYALMKAAKSAAATVLGGAPLAQPPKPRNQPGSSPKHNHPPQSPQRPQFHPARPGAGGAGQVVARGGGPDFSERDRKDAERMVQEALGPDFMKPN